MLWPIGPIKIKHSLSVSRDHISGLSLELIEITFSEVDRQQDTVFDWIAGSSQVITLGEKEEVLAKATFQQKLAVGALLTFLPTF